MAQLIVRNLPQNLVRSLRIRAASNGRSAESEHRLILEKALDQRSNEFWEEADALRSETEGVRQHESSKLLRKMRDGR